MGDFLFTTWSVRRGRTAQETERRAMRMLDQAKERIRKLTKVPLYLIDQGDYNSDELERAKEALLVDIEEVRAAFSGESRSASVFYFGRYAILITGGMSWGDMPTDLFSSMDRLTESGLLKDERPR